MTAMTFFFFQAEDGIRDSSVTGVQTCALPICNGRVEADEIDIETKFAGRIAALFADEGDLVMAGQPLARMDTRDLEASLAKAAAQVMQASRALDEIGRASCREGGEERVVAGVR